MKNTRELLQSGAEKILKAYPAEVKSIEGRERQYEFTITTSDVDRENDTIDASGWVLDNYLRNPVVLFAHDYRQPPVGVSRAVSHYDRGLKSVCEFVDPTKYAFAGTIAALVEMGALRATSVGFRTLEWTYDETRGGINFLKQELLEYSIVPVPANPHCLIEARGAGVDVEPLREWAARTLEALGAQAAAKVADFDVERFKAQVDEACGAVGRLSVAIDGLQVKLVARLPSGDQPMGDAGAGTGCPKGEQCGMNADGGCALPPGECPKKSAEPGAGSTASEPAREAPVEDRKDSDQGGGPASEDAEFDLDAIEDDELTDDDVRAAVREAMTQITKESVDAAMNRRLGRVD